MRHDTTHGLTTSDALAPGSPDATPGTLAGATPTAAHSLSANTRSAYTRALRQFDTWRGALDKPSLPCSSRGDLPRRSRRA